MAYFLTHGVLLLSAVESREEGVKQSQRLCALKTFDKLSFHSYVITKPKKLQFSDRYV